MSASPQCELTSAGIAATSNRNLYVSTTCSALRSPHLRPAHEHLEPGHIGLAVANRHVAGIHRRRPCGVRQIGRSEAAAEDRPAGEVDALSRS